MKPVPGIQNYYSSIKYIGKHYLVRSLTNNKRRHYTVTNCLQPGVYEEYLALINGSKTEMNSEFFAEKISNFVTLTIKNYKVPLGLSTKIHNQDVDDSYEMKGPMGKGLNL